MVTNVLCRLINKIINEKLQNFILGENIMNENQYGFIRGKGTQPARTKLMEYLIKSKNDKEKCFIAALDINSAYNNVDH